MKLQSNQGVDRRATARWMLAAAVAGLAMVGWGAGAAYAQGRVNNGNVLDANNRVGSGGSNDGAGAGNRGGFSGVTGNDIVLNNVTGGKGFRGTINYTDPRAFRGNTGSSGVDSFIAGSSGSGFGGYGGFNSNAQQVRPFYSDARGVAPPPDYTQQGFSGAYVPATPSARSSSDIRLGSVFETDSLSAPRPGELVLPGPVTNQNNNTLLTASPLYGVRQWDPSRSTDQNFLNQYTSVYTDQLTRQSMDQETLDRMRAELQAPNLAGNSINQQRVGEGTNSNQNQNQSDQQQQNNGTGTDNNSGGTDNPNLAKPLPTPLETPQTDNLTANNLGGDALGGQPMSTALTTGQSFRQSVIGMVPQQQRTTQYSALSDRLKQYYGNNQAITDAQAVQRFNDEVRAMRQRAAQGQNGQQPRPEDLTGREAATPSGVGTGSGATTPGTGTDTTATGDNGAAIPRVAGPTGLIGKNRPKPEQVPTLRNLVKAKGLAEVLQTAEDLMRQGKYISALDQYDAAQQIAPNYAVTTLGRANAELGASYYTRAEIDLRQAFTQDPSLLEGQYDLRGMIGDDRLNFLTGDLKQIVNREKSKPGPLFLLAYIMYNTGNERLAGGYLDLAEKRAGANDTFYRVVRAHWQLPDVEAPAPAPESAPTTAPTPELNK